MNTQIIVHAARTSGGILYLMALLLFIALAVIVERSWALARMQGQCTQWIRALKGLSHVEPAQLREVLRRDAHSPAAQVVSVALEHDLGDSMQHLQERLEEAVMDQAPRIDRGLWMLDTIVTLAPLLGLLGTIVGMFNTFQALSNPAGATQQVTGGVGEALLATAAGLFIAVLGLVAFNALHQRVRLLVHQLERIKVMLGNRMYPHYRGPREAARPLHGAAPRTPAGVGSSPQLLQ